MLFNKLVYTNPQTPPLPLPPLAAAQPHVFNKGDGRCKLLTYARTEAVQEHLSAGSSMSSVSWDAAMPARRLQLQLNGAGAGQRRGGSAAAAAAAGSRESNGAAASGVQDAGSGSSSGGDQ